VNQIQWNDGGFRHALLLYCSSKHAENAISFDNPATTQLTFRQATLSDCKKALDATRTIGEEVNEVISQPHTIPQLNTSALFNVLRRRANLRSVVLPTIRVESEMEERDVELACTLKEICDDLDCEEGTGIPAEILAEYVEKIRILGEENETLEVQISGYRVSTSAHSSATTSEGTPSPPRRSS
jgi:hypothetical protein